MTHSVGGAAAIEAVAHVISEAGAVPLAQTQIRTAGIFAAAAVVLHAQIYIQKIDTKIHRQFSSN